MKIFCQLGLTLAVSLASVATIAQTEMNEGTIGCPKNTTPAYLSLSGSVTNLAYDCPLLDNKKLRRLVEKFAAGTMFAWPIFPGTCFSGEMEGTLTYESREVVDVNAFASSAQRIIPVPYSQEDMGVGALAKSKDSSLEVGAAMTALQMDIGESVAVVLLDDHFLATEVIDDTEGDDTIVSEDTEEFLIVGSAGDLQLSGRLVGRGESRLSGYSMTIEFFDVAGNVCIDRK